MFFRNLTLFRFSEKASRDLDRLDEALDQHRLQPCGPLEMSTRGAVSPLGDDNAPLTFNADGSIFVCVGSENKLLPASIINKEVTKRTRQLAADEGRDVGGRERKRIKAQVLDELMPRALAKPSSLHAYADRQEGWIVFDTSSRKSAEESLSQLRDALGSFPAVPLAPEKSPRQLMTHWVTSGQLPAGLALGDECELRDPTNKAGAVIRCRHEELESREIQAHLHNGKEVYQLGLEFEDRIGFVLGEDMVIRKLNFFDVVTDELDSDSMESSEDERRAQFTLMALELRHLLQQMETWFALSRPVDS